MFKAYVIFLMFFLACAVSAKTNQKNQTIQTNFGKKATGYLGWPSQEARLNAPYAPEPVVDEWLPDNFSWLGSDIIPEIRDQGNCGSCYAQGITCSLEIAARLQGNRDLPNLSEQEIVSCAKDAYGCSGGFMTTADFIVKYGLADEKDFPYKAQNLRCKAGLVAKEKAVKYVLLGTATSAPSTSEIKSAIIRRGSVYVTVAAGGTGWNGSTGKVTGCRNTGTNHIVNLIGWTDKKEWVMRNSWGVRWGNKGYSLIPFGCDKIADEAGYVVVD